MSVDSENGTSRIWFKELCEINIINVMVKKSYTSYDSISEVIRDASSSNLAQTATRDSLCFFSSCTSLVTASKISTIFKNK